MLVDYDDVAMSLKIPIVSHATACTKAGPSQEEVSGTQKNEVGNIRNEFTKEPYNDINMRGRSYSYSPSPPRRYSRRRRSPSPRGRYGGRGRDLPTSLLVRNLHRDCRSEDLHGRFGQFGPLKDVYLPRDYYTGEPRGFGFVQYVDPADAADAKYHMDGQILLGRELTVVFAEENRKKPAEMRARERIGHMNIGDLVHHAMDEHIPLVQIIHLLHIEGDIPGQSHQETEGIGGDHTLDHLMDQEAGVLVTLGD
ncbi:RNA-binding domain superfamily [Sesbania bispinosa]|nr:RNA-binding domain superfamily [Sesbania bispinosa]